MIKIKKPIPTQLLHSLHLNALDASLRRIMCMLHLDSSSTTVYLPFISFQQHISHKLLWEKRNSSLDCLKALSERMSFSGLLYWYLCAKFKFKLITKTNNKITAKGYKLVFVYCVTDSLKYLWCKTKKYNTNPAVAFYSFGRGKRQCSGNNCRTCKRIIGISFVLRHEFKLENYYKFVGHHPLLNILKLQK